PARSAFARNCRSMRRATDLSMERGVGLPATVPYHLRDCLTRRVAPGVSGGQRLSPSVQRMICLRYNSSRIALAPFLAAFFPDHMVIAVDIMARLSHGSRLCRLTPPGRRLR